MTHAPDPKLTPGTAVPNSDQSNQEEIQPVEPSGSSHPTRQIGTRRPIDTPTKQEIAQAREKLLSGQKQIVAGSSDIMEGHNATFLVNQGNLAAEAARLEYLTQLTLREQKHREWDETFYRLSKKRFLDQHHDFDLPTRNEQIVVQVPSTHLRDVARFDRWNSFPGILVKKTFPELYNDNQLSPNWVNGAVCHYWRPLTRKFISKDSVTLQHYLLQRNHRQFSGVASELLEQKLSFLTQNAEKLRFLSPAKRDADFQRQLDSLHPAQLKKHVDDFLLKILERKTKAYSRRLDSPSSPLTAQERRLLLLDQKLSVPLDKFDKTTSVIQLTYEFSLEDIQALRYYHRFLKRAPGLLEDDQGDLHELLRWYHNSQIKPNVQYVISESAQDSPVEQQGPTENKPFAGALKTPPQELALPMKFSNAFVMRRHRLIIDRGIDYFYHRIVNYKPEHPIESRFYKFKSGSSLDAYTEGYRKLLHLRAVLSLHSTVDSTFRRDAAYNDLINEFIRTYQNDTLYHEVNPSHRYVSQLADEALHRLERDYSSVESRLTEQLGPDQREEWDKLSPDEKQTRLFQELQQIKQQQNQLQENLNQQQEQFAAKVGEIAGPSAAESALNKTKEFFGDLFKSK